MKVTIYVEGGGDNGDTLIRCKRGFAEYCHKLVPPMRKPKIVSCGGRQQAFDRFNDALSVSKPHDIYVLLVDSEGPMTAANEVAHLAARDSWKFPVLERHKVFLMVQAMEAWFLADRDALVRFYGKDFLVKSLPGTETNVEAIRKDDLEQKLNHAASPTPKREYHKTRHAFDILATIDPKQVESGSPHAKSFHDFLRSL